MSEGRGFGRWLSAFGEGVVIAFDSLRSNKVRSGLTILGVTIGVMVVMVMAAVIQGINNDFGSIIASRGVTTFYLSHANWTDFSTGFEDEESEWMRNQPLDAKWTRELAALPQIRDVEPFFDLGGMGYIARAGSDQVGASLVGASAIYMEIDNGDIIDGRFFTETEDERRANVAVIDSATAVDLFGRRDPIGRNIMIGQRGEPGMRFRVVGVYRPPPNLFARLANHYVFIPFYASEKYLDPWDRLMSFVIRPAEGVTLDQALDAVRGRMRQIRGLNPGEADNFALVTQEEIMDFWGNLTSVLFAVMVALSSVGLLVGGVGVIGIMMISVTERTREIGLRKAMGATRREIMWQFLVEAATLTLIGGAVGLILGGLIIYGLTAWTPVPAQVPLWSIAAALIVSALTGVGFGLYPASRGAKKDPVDALRYE